MTLSVGIPAIVCIILFLVGMAMLWERFFGARKDDKEASIPPVWAGIIISLIAVALGIYLWMNYFPSMYEIYRQQMKM